MPGKDSLGNRYTCYKCNSKFYDLGKPEPVCPKCGADQRERPAPPPPGRAAARPARAPKEEVDEDFRAFDRDEAPDEFDEDFSQAMNEEFGAEFDDDFTEEEEEEEEETF